MTSGASLRYPKTMNGTTVTVLCDQVGDVGGAERYWETVIPALRAAGSRVNVVGRQVSGRYAFGVVATEIAWSSEDEPPSTAAAARVSAFLAASRSDVVITASVFDRAVLAAVRAASPRWIARVHDHRAFCPNGDRVFPQFDAICTAAMGAGCAVNAVLRGCMHGPRTASLDRLAGRAAVRDLIARADAVLVSSVHMRETVVRNGIARERVALTPPPLPEDAFCVEAAPSPARPTLLFAARLTPQKGLLSLIRALARIEAGQRPLLIVAGRGDAEERTARELAARRGVEVEWAGWLTAGALRAAIDRSSAVAVPSLWPEPFGLVGSEAQARGRAAVAYDVGGIREWVGPAGIVVPRGDEAALADAIVAIVHPDVWPAYSAAARRLAERYRLQRHVAHLERLLDLPGVRAAATATPAA